MKRVITFLTTLFLVMSSMANAEPGGRGHMGMMDCECIYYYGASLTADASLNLTEEQIAKIQDMDRQYTQEMKSIQGQLSGMASELRLQWLREAPDRGKIIALQRDVTNLRNQMQEKMTIHRFDVFNILTREQQIILQASETERGYGSRMSVRQGGTGMGRGHSRGWWGVK